MILIAKIVSYISKKIIKEVSNIYILAQCIKCRNFGVLDIGDLSEHEVDKYLKARGFGECQFNGWHVEIGSMDDFIVYDYSKQFKTLEEANKEARRFNNDYTLKNMS